MEATAPTGTREMPPAPDRPRHGMWQALAALLLYVLAVPFLAAVVLGIIYGAVTGHAHAFEHDTALRAWTLLLGLGAACVVTLAYVRNRWRPLWSGATLPGLGFTGARAGQIAAGAALGLLAQVSGILLARWLGPPHPHPQAIMLQLLHMNHALWWLALPLTALLVPVTEETLFRGALFSAVSRHLSLPVAATLVTVVFVLAHLPGVHWNPLQLFGVAFTGIFAIWLRCRYRSIYPAIAVHMSFNAFAMLGLLALALHSG